MWLHEAIVAIEQLVGDVEKSERDGSGHVYLDDIDLLALKVILQFFEEQKVKHGKEKEG